MNNPNDNTQYIEEARIAEFDKDGKHILEELLLDSTLFLLNQLECVFSRFYGCDKELLTMMLKRVFNKRKKTGVARFFRIVDAEIEAYKKKEYSDIELLKEAIAEGTLLTFWYSEASSAASIAQNFEENAVDILAEYIAERCDDEQKLEFMAMRDGEI